jgi:anti-anti-sigma factor
MTDGSILHASHDGVEVLRFVGEIRYRLAPALDRYLESVFAKPGLAGFVIDLIETDSIDSTNLGILARIATHGSTRWASRQYCLESYGHQ